MSRVSVTVPPCEEIVILVSVVMWGQALALLSESCDFVLLDKDELIWLALE